MLSKGDLEEELDTSRITQWRSIITLLVFVLTNLVVLFPFDIPFYFPRILVNGFWDTLSALRIISPRSQYRQDELAQDGAQTTGRFVLLGFPMNFVTAPLIADLFLLAIGAIGEPEVYGGIIGANNIIPYDIMLFFLTLAYIAISIDASGLIRYLAFRVLQKGGNVGHRLFFYLYALFFVLGSFIGNDPIILSGTAFLAYMTRVSRNIVHPRAWIHTQFAVANIASAILVSSNPTNLVLAGAFQIEFLVYTAHMIVPVVVTAIVLFPFLLYVIFADESLIPVKIDIHQLPEEVRNKKPVNPNIPNARGNAEVEENQNNTEGQQLMSLEEIMNPFVDKWGAGFGGIIMAATLIAVLAINAASTSNHAYPVFYVTLPAAVIMLMWDLASGWKHRHETREIARKGREEVERARAQRELQAENEAQQTSIELEERHTSGADDLGMTDLTLCHSPADVHDGEVKREVRSRASRDVPAVLITGSSDLTPLSGTRETPQSTLMISSDTGGSASSDQGADLEKRASPGIRSQKEYQTATTVSSIMRDSYSWCQETFPTTTAVLSHLPLALVPFAFCMFILVQALVTKGWVPVFAYGWDHWVVKTGTIGAIGGMGFLSVIMCNFAGTNIGTTILLSRVIQSWVDIHILNGTPISERQFWATVYAMALGVNYGAFSIAFSAALAGLLWRDILLRKHIQVRRLDFARINIPIIAVSMIVGCAVLIGEVYIMKSDTEPVNLAPS